MPLTSRDLAHYGFGIRTAAVALYVVWVITGFCILRCKQMEPSHLTYIATRDLPAGHRLHASDFEFAPPIPAGERDRLPEWLDPVGKYVVEHHLANKPIAQSDLRSRPVIKVSEDEKGKEMAIYWFSLEKQAALANVLNAESNVDVCSGICIAQNVRVLSVSCGGTTTSSDCYAALELSAESSVKLAPVAKDSRLILRGDSTR